MLLCADPFRVIGQTKTTSEPHARWLCATLHTISIPPEYRFGASLDNTISGLSLRTARGGMEIGD